MKLFHLVVEYIFLNKKIGKSTLVLQFPGCAGFDTSIINISLGSCAVCQILY